MPGNLRKPLSHAKASTQASHSHYRIALTRRDRKIAHPAFFFKPPPRDDRLGYVRKLRNAKERDRTQGRVPRDHERDRDKNRIGDTYIDQQPHQSITSGPRNPELRVEQTPERQIHADHNYDTASDVPRRIGEIAEYKRNRRGRKHGCKPGSNTEDDRARHDPAGLCPAFIELSRAECRSHNDIGRRMYRRKH